MTPIARWRPWATIVPLLAMLASLVAVAPVRATGIQWNVGASCDHSNDIQAAVDAATSGDTIHICTGLYDLTASIDITKDLAFIGDGATATTLDGGSTYRILDAAGRSISIAGMTLRNGLAATDLGGAVRAANATVDHSAFSGNVSGGGGGAIGVTNSASVSASTFEGNSAQGGGAIYVRDSMATVSNSTFSGNTASPGSAGAILGLNAKVDVTNSTFVDNTAPTGGSLSSVNERLTLTNDVIAATSAGEACFTSTYVVQDHGGNRVTDGSCLPDFDPATTSSRIVTVEALDLGPLGSNGGPTQTVPLRIGSDAIDAGVDASCPPTDQRGVSRPVGPHCDAGAYEAPVLTDISIEPSGPTIAIGMDQQFTATGSFDDASTADVSSSVDWSSDVPDVATIDAGGLAHAIAEGTATIHASLQALDAATDLTVSAPPGTLYVAQSPVADGGGSCSDPDFNDIQSAVDVATAGSTVHVCAGTYDLDSTIEVSRALTLEGDGPAATILDAGGLHRILDTYPATSINGFTFRNGNAETDSGGAIDASGTLVVADSMFDVNDALDMGGAITAATSTLTVSNSTFIGNAVNDGSGGSIYVDTGSATITNSTFIHNQAGDLGGAIAAAASTSVSVVNSTFSGNDAPNGGAAIQASGSFDVSNSILVSAGASSSCHGAITDGGGNFATDDSCGLTEADSQVVNADDLHLDTLTGNGGPTLTIALGPGSLAIDAGRDATCPSTDQRGVARPQGPHCDSGAYEAMVSPDHVAPVVTPPADVTVPATDAGGAVVSYDAATAVDDHDGPIAPSCDPPPGSLFAVGVTTVTCSATDAAGNTGEATFSVTVTPFVTAPVVSSVSPATGPAAGGTVVVIAGSGFSGVSAVSFGGVAAVTFGIDSDTSLTATSPAGAGTVDVTVTSPSGTSATSSADLFTYAAPAPVTRYVSTHPAATGGGSCAAPDYNAIFAAVDAANPGDTIHICAGTYHPATIGVPVDLAFVGDGAATTIIDGSSAQGILAATGRSISIRGLSLRNGSAVSGGAISDSGGSVSVTDSTFSGNSAVVGGGAIHAASITVSGSTFSANSADPGGSSGLGTGGAILADGGTARVTDSTFSGDTASIAGGAIFAASAEVTNSTFSGDSASDGSIIAASQVSIANDIIASPSHTSAVIGCGFSTLQDLGGNQLTGPPPCWAPAASSHSVTFEELLLGPLADNGGPTPTIALGLGSSAIDAGLDAVCAASPVDGRDQRGISRPQGPHCDAGAYEAPALTTKPLTVSTVGPGTGSVSSTPSGYVDCHVPNTCTADVPTGLAVTLTATPGPGSTFGGWSGECSGAALECSFQMVGATQVTAGFTLTDTDADGVPDVVEAVAPNEGDGNRDGTPDAQQANVASLPGFGGGPGHQDPYLTIVAPPGSTFTRISTIDPGDAGRILTSPPADWELPAGLVEFRITGLPPGSTQTISVFTNAHAHATGYAKYAAAADPSWSVMPPDRVAVSTGHLGHVEIQLTDGGIGDADGQANGSIDDPGGPAIFPDTVAPVVTPPADVTTPATDASGAVVSYDAATALDDRDGPLTPTCDPAAGSLFAIGATTVTCTATDAAGNTGEATFMVTVTPLATYQLDVQRNGAGSGRVASAPAGIDCGADCSFSFDHGTSVKLTATPADDSDFAGWSGDCSGTSLTCDVSMNGARTVTATFTLRPVGTSTVITSDTSTPTVVGQPYEVAWSVTLDAPAVGTADGSVTLSDGTDACSASATTGSCTLTSTTAGLKHLVARFTPSDGTQSQSASDPSDHQVDPAATTTTILSDTPDPSAVGATYHVTWSVAVVAPGAAPLAGTVTVADDTSKSCSAAVAVGSCVMPSSPAGTRTLTATFAPSGDDLMGSADTATHTIVAGAHLSVTSVAPSSLGRGAHATLDVLGTGFSALSTVTIDGINIGNPPVTFVDSTHLRVTIDIPMTAGLGAHDVSVQEGSHGSGPIARCQHCLTIVAFALTSVDPATLDRGTSASFDIHGAGFAPSTRVNVHGAGVTAAVPTFIDSTHLRVLLTATSNAALTARQVDVTTSTGPHGTTATCPACHVTIVAGAHLSVTSVAPSSLGRGAHATLDVLGTGFSALSTVTIDGINIGNPPVTFVDSTHLRVTIDIPMTAGLGAHDVSVQEGSHGSGPIARCQHCLTIVAFALTSVDPATLDRGTSASFDIHGAGFAPSTRVNVHGAGVTAAVPTFIDSTHLRVLLTATSNAALTARQVDVTTSTGPHGTTATCPACHVTIVAGAHLSVTSVAPSSLGRGAHATLDVLGTGFSALSTVTIDGINIGNPPVTFVDSTHLRVTIDIPMTAGLGAHDVSVQEGSHGSGPIARCQHCLTIVAFALTSVDPATLDRGTSASFDIHGAGFAPSTRVNVHGAGVTAAVPTFIDSTHLRVLLTATSNAALTARQVDVTTSAGPHGTTATCPACHVTIVAAPSSARHRHVVARGLPLVLERPARRAPGSARRRS